MSDIQSLLSQFLGGNTGNTSGQQAPANNQAATSLTDKIPGGLMGGAAAGGIVTLLLGSKKARKFAGKAAGYGGAAVVGSPSPWRTSQEVSRVWNRNPLSTLRHALLLMKTMPGNGPTWINWNEPCIYPTASPTRSGWAKKIAPDLSDSEVSDPL